MGLVKMSEKFLQEWEDLNGAYPYYRATLYIYCDQCGSFSIKSRLGLRKIALILTACMLIALGTWAALHLIGGIYGLCLCLAICLLMFRYLWGEADYACRKCGSIPSTDYNTLGYPSDPGIVDIPDRLTQKRCRDYFPDQYDLDSILKSPDFRLTTRNNSEPLIIQDLNGIKNILLTILAIPLLLIFTVIYPILLIIYALWTEVVLKLWRGISAEKKKARP